MNSDLAAVADSLRAAPARVPTPVLALDVPDAKQALALAARLPEAEWVKVGLQLFTAAGPEVVRALRECGRQVFLDLKLHDIPHTVGRAVEAAGALGVGLLTVHASGGAAMLRAARAAAGEPSGGGPRLLAVTLLTSLSEREAAEAWGRSSVSAPAEASRLAVMAHRAGIDGVVASVAEAAAIRQSCGPGVLVLSPGIRLPGDARGDQIRIATPAEAARAGVDFLVVGRAVTAAADPPDAFARVLQQIASAAGGR